MSGPLPSARPPVDGAGSHIRKVSPSKRIKALHRHMPGPYEPLRVLAQRIASVESPSQRHALAWLANKRPTPSATKVGV